MDQLPQDTDAEQVVLGSVLLDNNAVEFLVPIVDGDDFYLGRHREVWRVMMELYAHGDTIDPVTVANGTKDPKLTQLEVFDLQSAVTTSRGALKHARIVADKARLRKLVSISAQIREMVDADEDTEAVLRQAEALIYEVSEAQFRGTMTDMNEAVRQAVDQLEELYRSDSMLLGVATGYDDYDYLTGGLMPGSLNLLAARPSVGKTALACGIAQHLIGAGHRVGFISLEMSRTELATRFMLAKSGVSSNRLRGKTLVQKDFEHLMEAANSISTWDLDIVDHGSFTPIDMAAQARRIGRKGGLKLLIVDYLQLMTWPQRTASRNEEVTMISRAMKLLAKEMNVPILALSQLNRAARDRKDKRPQLMDLRDSGSLEQDADTVLFLHREPGEGKNLAGYLEVEAEIAKHRNGPTGEFQLMFEPTTMLFSNGPKR